MPSVLVDDLVIEFPYEPYEVQKRYMSHVIMCLEQAKQEKIGLLESPTGSGKTSALLCSVIAWILKQKNSFIDAVERKGSGSDSCCGDKDFPMASCGTSKSKQNDGSPHRVVYATRTHAQIKEAIREFKETFYSRIVRMVVLGSREQMCVFPPVAKLKDGDKMKCACEFYISEKAIIKKDGNVDDQRCQFERIDYDDSFFCEPMDIEDLVATAKDKGICPYFAAVAAAKDAVITFCPYDYVLEEVYYNKHTNSNHESRINLQDAILIFDEGHNIQAKFEDFASAKIDTVRIQICIDELQEIVEKERSPTFTSILKFLKNLLNLIDSCILRPGGKEGILEADFSNEEMFDFLSKCDMWQEILSFPNTNQQSIQSVSTFGTIVKFFNRVSYCCPGDTCYKLHLEEKPVDEPNSKRTTYRTLEFWCVDPSVAMNKVRANGVHSILITSGTLAPISMLKLELGIYGDAIELKNRHVVENYQVMARIVSCGPDGVYFDCSYRHRSDEDYLHSVGLSIFQVSNVAKHKGVIVIFPSYEVLENCKEKWNNTNEKGDSLWSQLCKNKEVYQEPRKNDEFEQVIKKFKSCISEKRSEGAVLLAVFRGKVAEGLDLKDDYGRVVILVGIPYRPRSDPRVQFKMKYIREKAMFNEGDWYFEDAMRTANQAMGRVIRHIKDYGAIFLFDSRFRATSLPCWLKDIVMVERRFFELIQQMEQFFSDVEERVNARFSIGQHHDGNYRSWEVRNAQLERQGIMRKNEQLSRQEMSYKTQIKKLEAEGRELKRRLTLLEETNRQRLLCVLNDSSPNDSNEEKMDLEIPDGLSRKRQHSPESSD